MWQCLRCEILPIHKGSLTNSTPYCAQYNYMCRTIAKLSLSCHSLQLFFWNLQKSCRHVTSRNQGPLLSKKPCYFPFKRYNTYLREFFLATVHMHAHLQHITITFLIQDKTENDVRISSMTIIITVILYIRLGTWGFHDEKPQN